MNIILIGPPASGKGTQAKLLEKELKLVHISTGDLLREISSQKSKLANEIKSLIDNGHFVPDEMIIELVQNKLNEIKSHPEIFSQNGVLFDGFPRTVNQAQALENMTTIDYIFEITSSKASVVQRVTDRAVCKNCGKAFRVSQTNLSNCDVCGGDIVQRKDDTAEIAAARFDDYIQKTYPIVDYFKNHKGFHQVDGEKSIEEVSDQILNVVKEKI